MRHVKIEKRFLELTTPELKEVLEGWSVGIRAGKNSKGEPYCLATLRHYHNMLHSLMTDHISKPCSLFLAHRPEFPHAVNTIRYDNMVCVHAISWLHSAN